MARLTKRQRYDLERSLSNLERGMAFLMSQRVAVCKVDSFASTSLHYTRPDGRTLYEIDKEIGSELCLLQTAMGELRSFLAINP